MNKVIHQGRNEKRFREVSGIKQKSLACHLGEDWNQKKNIRTGTKVIDR